VEDKQMCAESGNRFRQSSTTCDWQINHNQA